MTWKLWSVIGWTSHHITSHLMTTQNEKFLRAESKRRWKKSLKRKKNQIKIFNRLIQLKPWEHCSLQSTWTWTWTCIWNVFVAPIWRNKIFYSGFFFSHMSRNHDHAWFLFTVHHSSWLECQHFYFLLNFFSFNLFRFFLFFLKWVAKCSSFISGLWLFWQHHSNEKDNHFFVR